MAKYQPKSVLNPSAQSTKLLHHNQLPESALTTACERLMVNTCVPEFERLLIELMYLNGLRVSEVLKIQGGDIISRNSFIIRASKGSSDRIGYVVHNVQLFSSFAGSACYLFDCFSRFYIYRLFKRVGLSSEIIGNRNRAVTHSLRHQRIESIQSASSNVVGTAQLIGHKNVKSTAHYLSHTTKK